MAEYERRYIKSAHGMHVYKDPYSENKHFKNADKGKREDTMQNFDYENDGAEYLPIRNIQRRRDERYMEISDQEYHHKEGRSKEPKGRDAVRGTRDGYMMPATEQYSDEFQMAERRVYRRRPGFSYESAKDERKDEYSSDEEILDENVPSLVHQPDRPGQHRNIAKQRVYDENARPGIPSIRRRPARFKFDDDEEEDEEEYVPIRTPRKQKTDQNTPNHYDDDRRGGQKSPNINQEFCRRRNYSLRDRHHGFSFPKDVPRQRNYFPNEAPVYRRPPRDQRRVRGPQSLSELSIREDPRKHRVQANDFISDEDDDNSEYEEIRGQKHKFSGIRREHPDNARLLKMSQRLRDASRESDEMNEDENGVKEQNEGDSNSESVNVEEITSNEGSRKDDEEGESNDEKGESDDEKRENDDKQTESYGGVTESGDDGRESDDEESEGYGGATESDDDERESDDEESGDDDTNRKLAQGARESDDEESGDDGTNRKLAQGARESDDEESEGYGGVTESDDDERESDDEESGDDDTNRKLAQGARESDGKKENDDVENTVVAGEVEGRTGFLIGAEKFEYRVPPAGRRMRVGIGNVASEQVLEMNQGPSSLPFFPPEDDRGSSRQHHKRSSRRRRHDIFPDESYLEYKSLSPSFASGYYNRYHREEEQFQTLSPQLLVDVLIKCPDYCSTLLYFVEKFDFRPSHIRKIVSKNSHVFVLDKEAIILQPKIELCSSHLSLNGCRLRLECGNIHVCPRFITSHCNEENCLFGHKFKTNHNLRSLRNYYLDHLSSSSLKQFFRSSASTESQGLIEICKDYNKGKCLQKNCLALHICSDYIANRLACTNRQCQLNHNLLSSETRWLLGRHGIDTNEAPRDIFAVLLEINPAVGETEKSDTETGCHSASNNSLPLPAVPVSGEEESADNNDSIAVSVSTTALSDSSAQDLIAAIRNIPPDTNTDSDNVTVPQPSSVVCNSDINNSSAIITQVPNNFVPRVPCTKELKVNIPSLWSHHLEGDVRVAEICYDSVVGSCPREQA
ncbi:uncharacterized protein LOC135216507 isoform X2 [Macrobrachium nipponense]|uniref:uncharacterized protein LOC135216507 isoform X2 n=1 Tax=Macrobrachium nipponense TaxID=159736 RepID=UPI0030C871B8